MCQGELVQDLNLLKNFLEGLCGVKLDYFSASSGP